MAGAAELRKEEPVNVLLIRDPPRRSVMRKRGKVASAEVQSKKKKVNKDVREKGRKRGR